MDYLSRGVKLLSRCAGGARGPGRRPSRRDRRLALELLESRQLLALTHLYTFNDGLANDWIGNAHGTLFNSATVTAGQLVLANAGVTSGQTAVVQYMKLPASVLPNTGAFTVEAWFTASDAANWSRVFDIGDQTGASGNSYVFYSPLTSFVDSRGVIQPAATTERIASGPSTNDGAQHLASVVVDPAADLLRLYIDGVETSTSPLTGASAASVNDTLAYLGRSLFNIDPGFTGSINEVRIYDEARTADAVLVDATTGPTTLTKALQVRQVELLNRGIVAVRSTTTQAYISWRLLGTDPAAIAFNVYRSANNGAPVKLNATPLASSTNLVDATANFTMSNRYTVRPVIDGVEVGESEPFTLAANAPVRQYLNVPLQVPAGRTIQLPPGVAGDPGSHAYTYVPNDAGVGDVDGDGELEIILKWDPYNPEDIDPTGGPRMGEGSSQDNSRSGFTGNVLMDAYKLDGTLLWRIDLGRNIRAGAHYTQFLVYDFDGDGKAEVVMRTAPGTIDGAGNAVLMGSDLVTADYRNSGGYILSGPEYLTVFNGATGANMSTVAFSPPRGSVSSWGDNYGNRVDRFLATVAYLDGVRPSIVMTRGYYAKTRLTAFDWRNGQLTQRWAFDSTTAGNSAFGGQGNHNLAAADVDADGKDEIVFGAAVFDDNGLGKYSTGLGHGDALHVSDMDPNRPGLEVWQIHEASGVPGADFRDAATGAAIFTTAINSGEGPGRGVAADIWAGNPGYEMWGGGGLRNAQGANIGRTPSTSNFLVWWDADPVRELLDGQSSGNGAPRIDKYGTSSDTRLLTLSGTGTNNSTKANPALSGDILGDWREEVIVRSTDNASLRIYTTTIPATTRMVTLLHDTQYREAIAWQNVAYNQPPHPSFFLGAGMAPPPTPLVYSVSSAPRIEGDFNGDNRVDALDLALWKQYLGAAALSGYQVGDADGDLRVDGNDFLAWQRNLGAVSTPPASETTLAAALAAEDDAPLAAFASTQSLVSADSAIASLAGAGLPGAFGPANHGAARHTLTASRPLASQTQRRAREDHTAFADGAERPFHKLARRRDSIAVDALDLAHELCDDRAAEAASALGDGMLGL